MKSLSLTINGEQIARPVDARTPLADFLRDELHLTGTHQGCEHGVCGACTILIDGKQARSCITYAVACEGSDIETVEGFAGDPVMDRLREAFSQNHALQCGFCTSGMLVAARDIVLRLPDPDDRAIRQALSGNLCRCTGYMGIVAAIKQVIAESQGAEAGREAASTPAPTPTPIHFAAFEPKDIGADDYAPPTPTSTASLATSDDGRTIVSEQFEVAFPRQQVWSQFQDLSRIVACIPGAELTGITGSQIKARLRIKFGPMTAVFAGDGQVAFDDDNYTGRITGAGADKSSASRASGDVAFALEELGALEGPGSGPATRVSIVVSFQLSGPLAQFSRSGLVADFAARLTATFAQNLENVLSGRDDAVGTDTGVDAVSLFLSMAWRRVRRLFSRT